MRVLHVIAGLDDGGAEAILYRLITRDNTDIHHVISLTSHGKYGHLLEQAGTGVTALNMPRGRLTPQGMKRLWQTVRRWRADVLQTWMYHADLLGGVVAKLIGIPVVWGIHNTLLEPGRSPKTTIWVAKLCAPLSRWIPERIAACAHRAVKVHAALGYDSKRMHVIPNGHDLSRFIPDAAARRRLRTEWEIPDNVALIGMVARFDPYKDHHNLIHALSLLLLQRSDFLVVLVGKGLDANNKLLMNMLGTENITEKVRLLGQRHDIPDVMNAVDLHVLSSSAEAFPNVMCEAMACGTPCVSTDVGDANSIVGETGWIAPPRDPQSLANAIGKALAAWDDKENWKQRQQQSRQRISDNFAIDAMVNAYRTLWKSAAARHSA